MRARNLASLIVAAALAALVPSAAAAQTVLRYTDHEPLGGMRTRFLNDVFFAAIERESKGRLRIEGHWDAALSNGHDAPRAIAEGRLADLGMVVPEYAAEALPLHQLFKSFPVGPTGARQVAFFRRAYAEVPALTEELARQQLVPVFLATGYPVAFFSAAPLASLAELKGQSWRTASFWHRDFLKNAGATPVTMPWGRQVFDALEARRLDGLIVNIDSGFMLKAHEPAPHVLASKDLWLGHLYIVAMNARVFAGLPQEDREAIARAAESAYRTLGDVMDASFEAMVGDLEGQGAKVRVLPRGEADAFEAAARYREVQAEWAKAQEAKGVTDVGTTLTRVRAILDEAMK